jgi:uncharacterized protein YjbI with pentapeptide repeats
MHWLIVGAMALGAGAGAAALFLGAWWAWWRLPKRQVEGLRLQIRDPKARADLEDNFRKTVGQVLGGATVLIAAGLGGGFAYLQFSQQQQASHELLISNQVAKGFEQLGSDKDVVRLGGIYALEGVMNTSEQYHQPVLEALSAFVRSGTRTAMGNGPPVTDIKAALTVIGRRAAIGTGVVDLSGANIQQADLSNADLTKALLDGVLLNDANLDNANLSGAMLFRANLSGASLEQTNLSETFLQNTNLSGAHLSAANLERANLIDANLSGIDLEYTSGINLRGANLSGANLSGAHLEYANLRDANLSGAHLEHADLSLADLTGAIIKQTQLDAACGVEAKLPPGLNLKPCNYPK